MKHRKLWLFAALLSGVLLLDRILGWSSYFADADNLTFLSEMVQENFITAILLYMVLTVLGCVLLALPGVTFAVLAGVLFGPWVGTLCCALATTIGAVCSFVAGRTFLKDSIKPVVMKNPHLKKWLFSGKEENMLFLLMITRLVPLFPYNLQNFAYGITDIRFGTYAIGSLIFMLPGTAAYTIGAAGIVDAANRTRYLVIAVILAIVVTGIGYGYKKRYIGGLQDEKRTD